MTGTVTVRVRRDADEQKVLAHVTDKLCSVVSNLCVQVVKDADWHTLAGGHDRLQGNTGNHGHGHSHDAPASGHGHSHDHKKDSGHGHGHSHDASCKQRVFSL